MTIGPTVRARRSTTFGGRWLLPTVTACLVVELIAASTALVVATRRASADVAPAGAVAASEALPPIVEREAEPVRQAAPVAAPVARASEPAAAPPAAPAADPAPAAAPAAAPPPAPAPQPAPAPRQEPAPAPRPATRGFSGDSAAAFAREFPVQAGAQQVAGDPASRHWALLIGINEYQGRTVDNIGSYQDAVALRDTLLARGWRSDHILLLGNGDATHDRIVRGLEWLIRSTDENSVVVFSYSGHTRQSKANADGDREVIDEGLWASDNRYVWDADLGRMLAAVRAQRMWITVQACEAAGFNDAGVERPGRLITYSSREDQKSYEDPEVNYSVMGRYFFIESLRDRHGDHNGDGRISVQEGFNWATPRTHIRTSGRQSAIAVDGLGGHPFYLEVGA